MTAREKVLRFRVWAYEAIAHARAAQLNGQGLSEFLRLAAREKTEAVLRKAGEAGRLEPPEEPSHGEN